MTGKTSLSSNGVKKLNYFLILKLIFIFNLFFNSQKQAIKVMLDLLIYRIKCIENLLKKDLNLRY